MGALGDTIILRRPQHPPTHPMEPNWTTARDIFERDLTVYDTPSGESMPASLEEQSSGSILLDQDEGSQPEPPSTLEFSDAEGLSQEDWQREGRPRLTRQNATISQSDMSGEGNDHYQLGSL